MSAMCWSCARIVSGPPAIRRITASLSTAQYSGGSPPVSRSWRARCTAALRSMASSSPASGGGAHEGSVVVGGLQQSGHQFWAVLADGGSLGFQAEVDL